MVQYEDSQIRGAFAGLEPCSRLIKIPDGAQCEGHICHHTFLPRGGTYIQAGPSLSMKSK